MAALRALLPVVRRPLRSWPGCAALRPFASGECRAEGSGLRVGAPTAAAPRTPGLTRRCSGALTEWHPASACCELAEPWGPCDPFSSRDYGLSAEASAIGAFGVGCEVLLGLHDFKRLCS